MIRRATIIMALAILWPPVWCHAQGTSAVLDSLMDTADVPKPLLDVFVKAYDENWVLIGGGFHQNYFFIPRTTKSTPRGTRTVWGVNVQSADPTDWFSSRAVIAEQRQRAHRDADQYGKYLLTKVQWEIDCDGQRTRINQMIDYAEDGAVIWSVKLNERLEEPVPDTNGERLLRAFCHPSTRITFRDLVNTPMGVQVPEKP